MAHAGPNPDHGFTSFDNIGWSLLMALQILTMDYWENLYEKVIQAIINESSSVKLKCMKCFKNGFAPFALLLTLHRAELMSINLVTRY